MCATCVAEGEPLRCLECYQARFGDLAKGPFSLARVFSDGAHLVASNAGLIVMLAMLAAIIVTALEYNLPNTHSSQREAMALKALVDLIVGSFGTTVLLLDLRNSVTAATAEPLHTLREAVGRFRTIFIATVTYSAVTLVGLLLFVYPGLRMACALTLCQCVAALEPGSPPLRTSAELTEGHQLELAAIVLVAAVVTTTVSGLGAGIVVALSSTGRETWPVWLLTSLMREGAGYMADVFLFCAYVRLRHGAAATPATTASA